MNISLVQMPVFPDVSKALQTASEYVSRAAEGGAKIVSLPEMFCCPYDTSLFSAYAEERGGRIYTALSRIAEENSVTLIGGSFPEREGDSIYNTCFVFDDSGKEIARHRKVHLFDINISGGQRFMESDTLSAGEDITLFSAYGHVFGVCICFDIRFPELIRAMALKGAQAVFVPAAFNMTTGPMHWEITFRMRAVDNQIYMFGIAPARDESAHYVSYANSIACSPWGNVIKRAGEREELLTVEADLDEIYRVRAQLPLLSARRPDVY